MSKSKLSLSQSVLSATLISGLLLVTELYKPAQASLTPNERETLPSDSLISVRFEAPGDGAPKSSIGGGVRGNVQFAVPGDAAPRSSVGGGVRGNVQFAAPGEAAPRSSVGGGVRGNVQFGAPGDAAPRNSVGGGVRGNVQFAAPGEAAPRSSVGGGVRGNVQFGAPGDAAPRNSVGGGVRGVQFGTPGDAAPRNSVGGGVRGDEPPAMAALLPSTKNGRTVSAHPTFFVYLPPTLSKEVFFSVQDEQGNNLYQTRRKISGQGGIISVTLPENAPALETGKNYVWFFAPILPDGILRPDNYVVTGWVKRVEANVGSDRQSPVEQATAYGKAGIWYDTLKILATAQRSQPNNANLTKEWKELLEQVGLNAIATQPLAEQL